MILDPFHATVPFLYPNPLTPTKTDQKKEEEKKTKLEIGLHLPGYEVEDTLNCPVYNEWIY